MNTGRELTSDELDAVSGAVGKHLDNVVIEDVGGTTGGGATPASAIAYTVTAILLWPEMEQIVSKTNDTSNVATFEHRKTLADSELDAVSGGAFPIVMAQMALLRSVQSGDDQFKESIHIDSWS